MASTEAPGRLELVRSFVNTVEAEDELDLLQADGNLPQWCHESGFCPDVDAGGLAALRGFREAIRGVLEANAGEGSESDAWRALEPYARRSCYELSILEPGRPGLRARGAGPDYAISELFAIVYDSVGEGTWRRLKACRKHSCRWAFYDRSKNGSGAWCSMRTCGNRVKAQRRRARQKNDG
jgi:predicted RNA-binding Zn ribbon-like protein